MLDSKLIVVLDNSSQTNLKIKSVPDVYAHLLQHSEVLYKIAVTSSRYLPNYTAKRTTSKELTNNAPEHLGFRIVIAIEKHIIGCFEIGGHKTTRL